MSFERFWESYPKRLGANPRSPAEKKFQLAIKSGADVEHIISSVKRYADELREQNKIGTEFVCQAVTWLNQKRWIDYAPDNMRVERESKIDSDMAARGFKWDGNKWIKEVSQHGPR